MKGIALRQLMASILIGAVVGGAAFLSISIGTNEKRLASTRQNFVRPRALILTPSGGLQGAVDEGELRAVLQLVMPRWRVAKTNSLMHALRLWGVRSEFGDDPLNPYHNGTPSGSRMLTVLLDSLEAERAGVQPYPFLHRTESGVGVQYEAGGGGVAHHDQYLKVMGELGLASDTRLRLPDGGYATLEDVVHDSMLHFDIEQELEFTAVAFSRWLPPAKTWNDRFGYEHYSGPRF